MHLRLKTGRLLGLILISTSLLWGCADRPSDNLENQEKIADPIGVAPAPLGNSLLARQDASNLPNPTPTAEILPTQTAAPTATPSLTPTPAPLRIGADWAISAELNQALQQLPVDRFVMVRSDTSNLDIELNLISGEPIAEFVFAAVAPFPTVRDGISFAELQQVELFGTAETVALWQPVFPQIQLVDGDQLAATLWTKRTAFAIAPFDQLTADLKVLQVEGQSPLKREFDPAAYPLALRVGANGDPAAVADLRAALGPLTNRDPEKMTRIAMSGVTALVRATAAQMEYAGVLFPGEVVAPIMQAADIAHVSNEVPFAADCPFPNAVSVSVVFCSRDHYFQLLEHLGVDVVEVTGNHSNDYGTDAMLRSLNKYGAAGMNYYGGGRDHSDAFQPAYFYDHGNKIAFIGCNSYGPVGAWATFDRPGTANCGDLGEITAMISRLSAEGYVVISTFQYEEIYSYAATASQKQDFGTVAEAGAAAVSGSQAHHPQAFDFHNGAYIHYGLGNLFFDQMFSLGTRQTFIDQYVIYDGRLISVELWTGIIEHYSRPREMTPAERAALLNSVFRASGW